MTAGLAVQEYLLYVVVGEPSDALCMRYTLPHASPSAALSLLAANQRFGRRRALNSLDGYLQMRRFEPTAISLQVFHRQQSPIRVA